MKKDKFTLRPISENDITVLMPIMKEYYDEINTLHERYHEKTAERVLRNYIDSPEAQVFVVEENDEILGVGGVLLTTSLYDYGQSVGYELMWYAKKGINQFKRIRVFKEIYKAIETISNETKLEVLKFMLPTNSSVCRFLEKRGFEKTEIVMARRKQNAV